MLKLTKLSTKLSKQTTQLRRVTILIGCKQQYKLIRETPTSAGPNSFGKTKQGFCDSKKVFEKNLNKAALEQSGDEDSKKDT